MKLLPVNYTWFLQLCVVVLPCLWRLSETAQCVSLLIVKLLANGFLWSVYS